MMKELMRESYASEWKKAYTATKIYSGFFNFTKVMYEPYFDDDNRPETRETKKKMKEIFGRTITEIEQHYLSTGDLELIESPLNRTFGNMTFFVNMRSSTTAKSLSERIKNVWQTDNLGLDFSSIDITDYNECMSHWNDCNENAKCTNTEGAFTCTCNDGLTDHSRVLAMPPGRICKNETLVEEQKDQVDPGEFKNAAIDKASKESVYRWEEDEKYRDELTKDLQDPHNQNPFGQPTLPPELAKLAPKAAPGEWTEGIDWPGPTGVKSVITGPDSFLVTWQLIDHDAHGNRFFYVVGFRLAGAPSWEEWPLGSKSFKVTLNGMKQNRLYEIRVGTRKMDTNPGDDIITAWSKSVYAETVLNTYKAQLIISELDWDPKFKNEYSNVFLKMTKELKANIGEVFGNQAMTMSARNIVNALIDFDDFNYVSSKFNHVIANWKLFFRPSKAPLQAEVIDKSIKAVITGDAHTRYGLRRTERISSTNRILVDVSHFEIRDIDECSTQAGDDCDINARCINTPGNFKCVCPSNYDDVSNKTVLPPGRACLLDPTKPIDYDDELSVTDILVDNTIPSESDAVASKVLSGRPVKERLYGPKSWRRAYKVESGSLIYKTPIYKTKPVYSYLAYNTLKLNDEEKQTYRPMDVYDRESKTYEKLVMNGTLEAEIRETLRSGLRNEFVDAYVVGLRLSDRFKETIEVDYLIFMERREKNSDGWYNIYTPVKLGLEIEKIYSEYTPGAGQFNFETKEKIHRQLSSVVEFY